jgi:uncharacterized protein (DUF302 family)
MEILTMRRLQMRILRILVVLAFYCLMSVPAGYAGDGLVSIKSSHTVKETADQLASLLRDKGMTLFIRIDHTEGAKKVGEQLRPTEVVIFGNPKVGTPFMRCGQSVAIDLPQKALIWEDETGQVWLTYNDPRYLADRHGITECEEVIEKITKALDTFASGATNP